MDPTYPLVPVLNFLAAVLITLPFLTSPRMLYNMGTVMFATWVLLLSIIQGIGAIVWSSHSNNVAPIWCDIVSHALIGIEIGIPACTLAITHQLYRIARTQSTLQDKQKSHYVLLSDLALTVGMPVTIMSLYYIVQDSRFSIIEGYGCYTAENFSGVSVLLIEAWGIVLPVVSILVYCPPIIHMVFGHIKDISKLLGESSDSEEENIIRTRYLRILALGCIDLAVVLPLGILILIMNIEQTTPLVFYPGWDAVHRDWTPLSVPFEAWQRSFWQTFIIRFNQFVSIVLAAVFFLLLGSTGEAANKWKHAWRTVVRRTGMRDLNASKLSTFQAQSRGGRSVTFERQASLDSVARLSYKIRRSV